MENPKKMIPVPDDIASAALGGLSNLLQEVRVAYHALQEARDQVRQALHPEVSRVLASGLAHEHMGPQDTAEMLVLDTGNLVVEITTHKPSKGGHTPKTTTNKKRSSKLPSMDRLRNEAKRYGVDLDSIKPRSKRVIMSRIEDARNLSLTQIAVCEAEVAQETGEIQGTAVAMSSDVEELFN